MVEAEFENIMHQLRNEANREPDPKAALDEIEAEKDDYRRIAERRVRLGLLLSEIGAANNVQITDSEMNQLIAQAASQYQGKERERFLQYVQQEPAVAAQLRAPLYEDKVVDFLFSKPKSPSERRLVKSWKRIWSPRKAMSTGRAAAMTSARKRSPPSPRQGERRPTATSR
jgi:FKBP-type peptidyl-prolyl cis-trans isomerase (trigger factor)